MRVAIVGSRDYPQLNKVRREIDRLAKDDVILTGDARGVDTVAHDYALATGRKVLRFEVDKVGLPEYGTDESRREYGKRAYARNERLIAAADRVIAFWDGKSRGTRHALDCARKLNKPRSIIHWDSLA